MNRSEERCLVTHVGSLPRPPKLTDLMVRRERGEAIDAAEFERESRAAVRAAVARQFDVGIDIGNDGEMPRVGFQTYVAQRMQGFGGESHKPAPQDLAEFPECGELLLKALPSRVFNAAQAIAEVAYVDLSEAEMECDLFLTALQEERRSFAGTFMTAATPGIIATTLLNAYYDTHEDYVMALAREMKKEYELIHSKGFDLQLDSPDLAMDRSFLYQHESLDAFLRIIELHVEAINAATENIPAERIRLHVCWGNWAGPHNHDVALAEILPILYQAKVGGLSVEFSNPRHQHEFRAFERHPLPDHMVLLPGVIDSTSNFVEHPEVVAMRLAQAVAAVGERSRVIASTDCGFGTFAGYRAVVEDVVWAKLAALVEGARLASARIWERAA